jgi:hypothetical protein
MGPNRNPRWSKSGLSVTLSYLEKRMRVPQRPIFFFLLKIIPPFFYSVTLISYRHYLKIVGNNKL